jgi:hypothetical protein
LVSSSVFVARVCANIDQICPCTPKSACIKVPSAHKALFIGSSTTTVCLPSSLLRCQATTQVFLEQLRTFSSILRKLWMRILRIPAGSTMSIRLISELSFPLLSLRVLRSAIRDAILHTIPTKLVVSRRSSIVGVEKIDPFSSEGSKASKIQKKSAVSYVLLPGLGSLAANKLRTGGFPCQCLSCSLRRQGASLIR